MRLSWPSALDSQGPTLAGKGDVHVQICEIKVSGENRKIYFVGISLLAALSSQRLTLA